MRGLQRWSLWAAGAGAPWPRLARTDWAGGPTASVAGVGLRAGAAVWRADAGPRWCLFFFFFLRGVGAVLGFAKEDLVKEVFVLSTPIPGFQAVPVLMEGLHTWIGVGLGEVRVR